MPRPCGHSCEPAPRRPRYSCVAPLLLPTNCWPGGPGAQLPGAPLSSWISRCAELSPRLLIPSRVCLPPLEFCRGTNPSARLPVVGHSRTLITDRSYQGACRVSANAGNPSPVFCWLVLSRRQFWIWIFQFWVCLVKFFEGLPYCLIRCEMTLNRSHHPPESRQVLADVCNAFRDDDTCVSARRPRIWSACEASRPEPNLTGAMQR